MTISPEAKEATEREFADLEFEEGYHIQLAINSATAPLQKEINELVFQLKIRKERVTTHSDRCHLWHIECAVSRLESATKEIERLRGEIDAAWFEARRGYSISDEDLYVTWEASRAKRVAEGKE